MWWNLTTSATADHEPLPGVSRPLASARVLAKRMSRQLVKLGLNKALERNFYVDCHKSCWDAFPRFTACQENRRDSETLQYAVSQPDATIQMGSTASLQRPIWLPKVAHPAGHGHLTASDSTGLLPAVQNLQTDFTYCSSQKRSKSQRTRHLRCTLEKVNRSFVVDALKRATAGSNCHFELLIVILRSTL